MKLSKEKLNFYSLAYIYLPVIIFIVGWCRLWFSIPAIFMLGYAFFRTLKLEQMKGKITFQPVGLGLVILAILIIAYYSGLGGNAAVR